jgi:hypothetical protein
MGFFKYMSEGFMGVLSTRDRVLWVFKIYVKGFYGCFKYISQDFISGTVS